MMNYPDFLTTSFLEDHIKKTLKFYENSKDVHGFFHYFLDNGEVYNKTHRHLVSSTRFVFNYGMAYLYFGDERYRELAQHAINYLREFHRNPLTGGYSWTILDGKAEDSMNHCYGLAFLILAYSVGHQCGLPNCLSYINETWDLLEKYYFEPSYNLYRDEADVSFIFTKYRGQNANMHICEAMLQAYEATKEIRFLERAYQIAYAISYTQANKTDNLVWEHYYENWEPDYDYHKDDPKHLFRPWGYQPGHQIEWSKLLLILLQHLLRLSGFDLSDRTLYRNARGTVKGNNIEMAMDWIFPRSKGLFDRAFQYSWDPMYGGLCYGFAPGDYSVCDDDKYYWVQAEALATLSWLIYCSEGEERLQYLDKYNKLWKYCWNHFIDHNHGAWFRILSKDNQKYSNEKSPAGKNDYHTMGACYEILKVLKKE